MKQLSTRKKRRSIHFAKPKIKSRKRSSLDSFLETLHSLNRDFSELVEDKKAPEDIRLMQRVALNIRHLFFDARRLQKFPQYQESALHVLLTLTTPWGAPFVLESTLLDAAEDFGTQNPKYSDLHKWLSCISKYGHHFPKQILSMVHEE